MKFHIFKNDPYNMNWVDGVTEWGTVKAPDGISVNTETKIEADIIIENYTFTNVTSNDIFTSLNDISIYTPFNDDYVTSDVCVTNRCHTHIWCGGDISYVLAVRMGGEPPHFGLVLTEGSLGGYSIERDITKKSNDRGDFILHPSPVCLVPNESFTVSWTLFPHNGKEDFYRLLPFYAKRFIYVNAKSYIVYKGESIHIEIKPVFDFTQTDTKIVRNDKPVELIIKDGTVFINETIDNSGEYIYRIDIGGIKTKCTVLVLSSLDELAEKRCHFIVKKQQYHCPNSHLDGAFLAYDTEEEHMVYKKINDYNGGRERIGMGLLLIQYLLKHSETLIHESLKKYTAYIERELFDKSTGTVYNDCNRDNSYKRLYNYPWVSLYYLELFFLYKKDEYLINSYMILRSFYEQNGAKFYAIEIPLERIYHALGQNHMITQRDELMGYFTQHCDYIIQNGAVYPKHEVNFEQSIAAPAAYLLIQMYNVTKDKKYLDGAVIQLKTLELFNGWQPDYHLYEVAIRHWDGYWFGKRKMYGDTYPHYWSALTANVYRSFSEIEGYSEYGKKADYAYRAVLSLIKPDGTASCAYVYPVSVNGKPAGFYDPYANDQDWGLYFNMRDRWLNS